MSWFAIFLFAATAVATDVGQCDGPETAAGPVQAPSVLQRASVIVSEQQLIKREEVRHNQMVEDAVERRLIFLGGMIREGMNATDAICLHQRLAAEFNAEDVNEEDLISTSSPHTLLQEAAEPLHDMLCLIRGAETDCEQEWSEFKEDVIYANRQIFSELGSSLLQFLTGKSTEKKRDVPSLEECEGREVDATMLELLKDNVLKGLKVFVRIGESPAAALQQASDTMAALREMDAATLLRHAEDNKLDIMKGIHVSLLRSLCRATTSSCVQVVAPMIIQDEEDNGHAQGGTSLLQVALNPAIRVVLKMLGIPESPKETAAERAVASQAYLKQRRSL